MPIIDDKNFDDYIDKEELFTQRKFGSGIYTQKGSAIYLPSGQGIGDFISSIANFVKDNKDTISSGIDTVSKVAKLGIDISKGVEEVNNLKALRQSKRKDKEEKSRLDYSPNLEVKNITGGSLEDKLYPEYNLSLSSKGKEDEELAEEIANASGSGFQILD